MKFIRTYEEFRFKNSETQVIEPASRPDMMDRPVDTSVLGGDVEEESEDDKSYVDSKGVVHIKNWKVY